MSPSDGHTVTATFLPNQSPIANAGTNQVAYNSVILDGTLSSDSDGAVSSYHWMLRHRDNSSYDRIFSGATLTVSDLAAGFYDVSLTVTDNYGLLSNSANILLAVVPANTVEQIRAGWYSQQQMDQAVTVERLKWDVGDNQKIGLAEAIRALQLTAGIR
jgi:hypothetical protein